MEMTPDQMALDLKALEWLRRREDIVESARKFREEGGHMSLRDTHLDPELQGQELKERIYEIVRLTRLLQPH